MIAITHDTGTGFGGSNVHVIIESYDDLSHRPEPSSTTETNFTPFTFSAISERALVPIIQNYLMYIEDLKSDVSLRNLAWTLQYKRSQFPFRSAFSAGDLEDLKKRLQDAINKIQSGDESIVIQSSSSSNPRIMAIFTGQGAQWATMGNELIDRSPYARDIIAKLNNSLHSLPESERPLWDLKEELSINSSKSRIHEAELSQALTTAIQILLVDLLNIAGVKLHTVVGHSSGEIAAAYAAGYITAEDAIRTAYYRGFHSKHAAGKDGQKGAMLVCYLTPREAKAFCELPEFRGRILPAAYNSPSAATLSGDADVIDLALARLEEQGTFARKLKVDRAYHSHHMQPCISVYNESLGRSKTPILSPSVNFPIWISSVNPDKRMRPSDNMHSYWVDNMTSPVRFSEAIATAISQTGVPDLCLEIGPHPALKKPVREIISDTAKVGIDYVGLLRRGTSPVVSFSDALGSVWTHFGKTAVNLENADRTLSNGASPTFVKDLPSYPWQHDKEFWWENRFLRRQFQSTFPPTELLGQEISMGAHHETKWRHFISPKDSPWILDHKLDGVAVLPGAAYVVMAANAARRLFLHNSIEMIEIQDLQFELPLIFSNEQTSVETIFTIINLSSTASTARQAQADFFVDFCSHQRQDELMTAARGRLNIRFGSGLNSFNPNLSSSHAALTTVNTDIFYNTLANVGYGYKGSFRSVAALQRHMDFATGKLFFSPSELIFHPAILDGLFQATFAAENYPDDSAMLAIRVPSLVRSIKIFPLRCDELAISEDNINFDVLKTSPQEYGGLLYGVPRNKVFVQMDGFCTSPYHKFTPSDDLKIFSEMSWSLYSPASILKCPETVPADIIMGYKQVTQACERVSLFYLRKLNGAISFDEEQHTELHLQYLLELARVISGEVSSGLRPQLDIAWFSDTEEDIADIVARYFNVPDMRLLNAMGKAYPSIIRGEQSALAILTEDDMLTKLYTNGLGFHEANQSLVNFVSILSQRSPNMKILEVGAGTGATAASVLDSTAFSSYVFTDISPAFLGSAKEKFSRFGDKISFMLLDLEKDITEQGFTPASFDVIVASNVLHALEDVQSALARLRQLLRPGGYLVCTELPTNDYISNTVIMGGLPGWWLGRSQSADCLWSPAIAEHQWDSHLQEAGFAGIDAITPITNDSPSMYRVFAAQAIDDRIVALRNPLAGYHNKSRDSLLIIGDEKHNILIQDIKIILSPNFQEVTHVSSLGDMNSNLTVPFAVLSLIELSAPVFADISRTKWAALQKIFGDATDVVWVTTGCNIADNIDSTYRQMMVGLTRTVRSELRALRLSFLDIDSPDNVTAKDISEVLLRWYMLGQWAAGGREGNVLFPDFTEQAIANGTTLVPTVVSSRSRNDRYNSQHRSITQYIQYSERPVQLHFDRSFGHYQLREVPPYTHPRNVESETITVTMLNSTLSAIKVKGLGFMFVGLGRWRNETHAVVLSENISSTLQVPKDAIFPCNPSDHCESYHLRAVAANILAERTVGSNYSSGSLVILTSDLLCLSLIREKAAKVGQQVTFITSDSNFERQHTIFLHEDSLDISVLKSLPPEVSAVINLSDRPYDKDLFLRIRSILDNQAIKFKDSDDFFRPFSSRSRPRVNDRNSFIAATGKLIKEVEEFDIYDDLDIDVVAAKDITQQTPLLPLSILDWTPLESVAVSVQPATAMVHFSPEKTYIIIGSSDLAQSICEWMVGNDARYIVMASRNPFKLTEWAESMALRGAFVDLHNTDVTNEDSIRRMITSVKSGSSTKQAAPAIGGVIHLALILADSAFSHMTFENHQQVTNVKTQGSLNLHKALLEEQLDFFILTSSISYIAGNPGQANYNCGNASMVGLANYRRHIGLPASVVHLGRVTGVGYLTRISQVVNHDFSSEELRKKGMYPVSERDLQHIFAEAVLASPADSGVSHEIIAGLSSIEPDMLEHCPWAKQPMFAHLLTTGTTESTMKPKPQLSVREKIQAELTALSGSTVSHLTGEVQAEPIQEIIQTALLDRLSVLLQIDAKEIQVNSSLLDLGIDSLVATEIGSWTRKELKVQVPHSIIFGGASVADIVNYAVLHLDKEWVMMQNGESAKGMGKA
jgi:malonyl CoA-acyl carrier protein transacylase/acyl carrier protein